MKKASSIFAAIMAASAAAADPVAAITDSSFDGKVLAVTYTLTEDAIVTFDVKTNGVTIGGAAVTHGRRSRAPGRIRSNGGRTRGRAAGLTPS